MKLNYLFTGVANGSFTGGMFTSQHWVGSTLLLLGVLCLWSGGRMGVLLPKPWSSHPSTWLAKHSHILTRSLVILAAGLFLALGGIVCFVYGH